MAVQLVDDLDGREIEDGDEAGVRFALDQVSHEMGLSTQHGNQLRAALQPYIEGAQEPSGAPGLSSRDRT